MNGVVAHLRRSWYGLGLAGAAAVGLAVRLVQILVVRPTCAPDDLVAFVEGGGMAGGVRPENSGTCFAIWGDSLYGYVQARLLASGHGYVDGATWVLSGGARTVPSAGDPPVYAAYLALWAKLGFESGTAARVASALAGVAGVVLVGMVGRRLAGRRAGVLAALVAAVNPMLWINDGMLLSEALYVPLVALTILVAYRFWRDPGVLNAVWLGAAVALAALTRAEAVLLFAFLVLPLVWGLRQLPWARRGLLVAVVGGVGALLILPWFAYNLSRFEEPVLMTAGTGAVLSAASCDPAFYGEYIGYYGAHCYDQYIRDGYFAEDPDFPDCGAEAQTAAAVEPLARTEADNAALAQCYPDPLTLDESQRDLVSREKAIRYTREHAGRLPLVVVARVGRMWDLYNPQLLDEAEPFGQNVRLNWQVEGRGRTASRAGLVLYYVMLPAAVWAGWRLWKARIPLSPLLSQAAVVTVTAAMTFGATRYRVPGDVVVGVLAAVALDALVSRWRPAPDGCTIPRRGARGAGSAPDVTPDTTTTSPEAEEAHA